MGAPGGIGGPGRGGGGGGAGTFGRTGGGGGAAEIPFGAKEYYRESIWLHCTKIGVMIIIIWLAIG